MTRLEMIQMQDKERELANKKQFDTINHFYELAKNTQLKNDELTIENKKLKNIIEYCLAEIKKVLTQDEMQYVIKTIKGE